MTYTEIKKRLRSAKKLIEEGKYAEADEIIRRTPGCTRHDMREYLGDRCIRILREGLLSE